MNSAARCAWLAAVKTARLSALSTSSQLAMEAAWYSRGYAIEELAPELGAAFLCADLDLTLEPVQCVVSCARVAS